MDIKDANDDKKMQGVPNNSIYCYIAGVILILVAILLITNATSPGINITGGGRGSNLSYEKNMAFMEFTGQDTSSMRSAKAASDIKRFGGFILLFIGIILLLIGYGNQSANAKQNQHKKEDGVSGE